LPTPITIVATLMTLRYVAMLRCLVGALGVCQPQVLKGGAACLKPNIMTF
jgi:hypothetical protein